MDGPAGTFNYSYVTLFGGGIEAGGGPNQNWDLGTPVDWARSLTGTIVSMPGRVGNDLKNWALQQSLAGL
jgi:hypothetical protein